MTRSRRKLGGVPSPVEFGRRYSLFDMRPSSSGQGPVLTELGREGQLAGLRRVEGFEEVARLALPPRE
jgi:hypothetical protein